MGTFAEYTIVDERIVGEKPTTASWSQAASLLLTALTAWEAIEDQLKIGKQDEGKTILMTTAGAGGVGFIAISITKKVFKLNVMHCYCISS